MQCKISHQAVQSQEEDTDGYHRELPRDLAQRLARAETRVVSSSSTWARLIAHTDLRVYSIESAYDFLCILGHELVVGPGQNGRVLTCKAGRGPTRGRLRFD